MIERWARLTRGEPVCTSVDQSLGVSSQPPERSSGYLCLPIVPSWRRLCWLHAGRAPVPLGSFRSFSFSLFLSPSLSVRGGNEQRVRTEKASRGTLSRAEEERTNERWANALLVRSPSPIHLSSSPPLCSVDLFLSLFQLSAPVFLRFFRSLSSLSPGVNVQARGVTEITHTLVANPLDCDSLLRLYLASNCSFLRDARRSARLLSLPPCLRDPPASTSNFRRVTWGFHTEDPATSVPAVWKLTFQSFTHLPVESVIFLGHCVTRSAILFLFSNLIHFYQSEFIVQFVSLIGYFGIFYCGIFIVKFGNLKICLLQGRLKPLQ